MYDPTGEPCNGHDGREFTPHDPEHRSFWGFTLSGSASLEEVARFYGLKVPGLEPQLTLDLYLGRNGNGPLRPGFRTAVGGAELLVLEMENGAVRRVGLVLRPARVRRPLQRKMNYRDTSA